MPFSTKVWITAWVLSTLFSGQCLAQTTSDTIAATNTESVEPETRTSVSEPAPTQQAFADLLEDTAPAPSTTDNKTTEDSQTKKSQATEAEAELKTETKHEVLKEQAKHDTVRVKGKELKGRLVSFDTQGIVFSTVYGKGNLQIPYTDIEDLNSLAPFYFHTTNESFYGRVISYRDGLFVIQNLDGNLTLVSPKFVRYGVLKSRYESNVFTQIRYKFPFWKGNFGLSLENDVTTIDKLKIRFSLTMERRLKPTRYKFDSYINYDEDNTNDAGVVTKDERYAVFIYEHDTPSLYEDSYAFLMPAYESDQIRLLNARWFPSAGLGYRFLENRSSLIQLQTGLSLIDIDYVSAPDQNFPALHFGAEANHTLQNGINFHGSAYYMPSLDRNSRNHITRVEFSSLIPLIDFVRAEFKYILLTDNSPEPDIGNNKKNFYIGININFLN